VEDRAYSLMGLLDMNMPMLYGERKKAFQCLQLEIICALNDQSIFAWRCDEKMVRTCSILADDLSFFKDCNRVIQTSILLVDFAVDFDFDLGLRQGKNRSPTLSSPGFDVILLDFDHQFKLACCWSVFFFFW